TDRRFRTAARQAEQTVLGALLRRLAMATGGQYHVVFSDPRSAAPGSQLEGICAEISQDLRHQYVLGFPTHEAGTPGYHRIRVEVAAKHVAVSHRRGYLGLPPLDS
ncbi:MAG: hypothetical protein GY856_44625, partial [bacterium]|nr:hypothetical protein [bacterium]